MVEILVDADIFGWLGYFSVYLDTLEELLEVKADSLKERYQEFRRKTGGAFGSPNYDIGRDWELASELEVVSEGFPSLLRSSFFLAVYSLLEVELIRKCYFAQEVYEASLSIDDLRGRSSWKRRKDLTGVDSTSLEWGGLKPYRHFLKYVAGIDINCSKWDALEEYTRLRNCVVHRQCYLTDRKDDEHLKKKYVPEKKELLRVASDWYGERVEFCRGFCEEVISTVSRFFAERPFAELDEKFQHLHSVSFYLDESGTWVQGSGAAA